MAEARPEVVFHMAAQALVGRSYRQPVETYSTNVMGTVHVLEAVRSVPSVRAVVVVTSDKVYDNRNWVWSYREDEPLGGHDPYSSSKGCAELVTAAYRRSFFSGAGAPVIATARAGNVIGGGDWSENRIVPDAARAFLKGEPLVVRNPDSVRPWQHVLDALSGYVTLAEALLRDGVSAGDAWNFGPSEDHAVEVATIAGIATRLWPRSRWSRAKDAPAFSEDRVLKLDSAKARVALGWRGRLSLEATLAWTLDWYRQTAAAPAKAFEITTRQIEDYQALPVGRTVTAAA
jgi:CDP-glucose 4,6-dehydratase